MTSYATRPTASARTPTTTPPAFSATEQSANEAVVRRLIEKGFNEGRIEVVDEVSSTEYAEHQRLAPGVPPTREATRAIIRDLRRGFPDFHLAIQEIDAVGDRVWLRMRATGTHRGPFMGTEATGRSISVDVMDLIRLREGKIVEHWGCPDQLAVLEQLGLLPAD